MARDKMHMTFGILVGRERGYNIQSLIKISSITQLSSRKYMIM
jgi:hypothetical protein